MYQLVTLGDFPNNSLMHALLKIDTWLKENSSCSSR